MTTKIDRAVNIIAGAGNCDFCEMFDDPGESCAYCIRSAETVTRTLADAGPLMPNLPKSDSRDGRTVWRVDEEGFVYIKPDGRIATIGVSNPYESPHIAYRHALAIIAAANHAEQEQGNEA